MHLMKVNFQNQHLYDSDNIFSVAEFSFMDINKAIIKNFTLHIGDKAGVKVDGVLSELPGEFTYEYVSRNFKPL